MNNLKTTISDLLNGSTELVALVGDNIYYNVAPQNLKNTSGSLVFSLSTTNTVRDLEGNIMYKDKICLIKINSKTQENIYNILDVVEELISECGVLETENGEVDTEPFWDTESQWFTLNFDFSLNDF